MQTTNHMGELKDNSNGWCYIFIFILHLLKQGCGMIPLQLARFSSAGQHHHHPCLAVVARNDRHLGWRHRSRSFGSHHLHPHRLLSPQCLEHAHPAKRQYQGARTALAPRCTGCRWLYWHKKRKTTFCPIRQRSAQMATTLKLLRKNTSARYKLCI